MYFIPGIRLHGISQSYIIRCDSVILVNACAGGYLKVVRKGNKINRNLGFDCVVYEFGPDQVQVVRSTDSGLEGDEEGVVVGVPVVVVGDGGRGRGNVGVGEGNEQKEEEALHQTSLLNISIINH